MNLIERLGGYEKAKAFLNATSFTIDELIMMQRSGLRTQHVEKALLDYRRQHNIFEVGDKVFYTGRANDNDLYTIKEIYIGHDFIVGDNGADKNFWTLFLEEIRHATDEEIKAGKRLEVK